MAEPNEQPEKLILSEQGDDFDRVRRSVVRRANGRRFHFRRTMCRKSPAEVHREMSALIGQIRIPVTGPVKGRGVEDRDVHRMLDSIGYKLPKDELPRAVDVDSYQLKYPVHLNGRFFFQKLSPNERFETIRYPSSGETFKMRQIVQRCFAVAERFAYEEGYSLKLVRAFGNEHVSRAEGDWSMRHDTGGAIDVEIYRVTKKSKPRSKKSGLGRILATEGPLTDASDYENLQRFMNAAGFVMHRGHDGEARHFAMGTPEWVRAMKEAGVFPPDAPEIRWVYPMEVNYRPYSPKVPDRRRRQTRRRGRRRR